MHTIGLTQWKHWECCKCIELCKTRLTNAKTSVSLRLNAFFSKNDIRCAKTRYFALKSRFMHTIGFNAMKALGIVQCIDLCKTRLANTKTGVSLRLNAFFSKNDVRCAKTRYFALKTRFMQLSVLTQWKHWEWCKCIELWKTRLTNAKTNVSLRLNAFFSKNDVRCSKTRYFSLKTRFTHTIGFNAMKALGMVQMHWNMQN